MVAIVTRAGKGSPLTNAEVDANFDNLNNGKVETTFAGVVAALGYTPVNKAGDTMTGALTLSANAGAFTVRGTDHVYLQFEPRGSVAGRKGYFGFGAANTANMTIANEDTGDITIMPMTGGLTLGSAGSSRVFVGLTGNVNIGGSNSAAQSLSIRKNITGGTSANGVRSDGTIQSDVTSAASMYASVPATAAATFNLSNLSHFSAVQGTFGAGSTVSTQMGFNVDANLTGATSNYAFRGQINSGTGRWNLFMDGTAQNFLGGATILNAALGFGASGSPSYGTSGQLLKSGGSGAAPSWAALTSGEVTTALGFTPYNSTNPSGYITNTGNARVGVENNGTLVGTRRNINFIPGTGISLSISDDSANEEVDITIASTVTGGVASFNTRTGAVTLSSGDVTGALGYTPYNSSNPSGYITSSGTAGNVTSISSAVGGGYTWTGTQNFQSANNTSLGGQAGTLVAYSTGATGATMSFHRPGVYAINMGLDNDNVFRIGGWSASANRLQMDMSGNLTMAGNVTANSDESLKKDWAALADDFIERLAAVKHGTYTRIDSGDRQAGSSAQDWELLLPEVVSKGADGIRSLAYGNAALVSAIQLAKELIHTRGRVEQLEAKLARIAGEG